MNNELAKFKHIAPIYIIAFSLTVIAMLAARWLLSIQFEILDISEDIWELWAPMILAWISMYFCLRSRLKILHFKNGNGNGPFAFQALAWLSLIPVLMISQSLLTTATSTLSEVENIYDIENISKSRYYKINDFQVANYFGGSHAEVSTSGRYSEHLNIRFYFVFPITKLKDEQLEDTPTYWYGIEFYKQISNRLEQPEKERIYDEFYNDSIEDVNDYNFHDLTMLERLPTSDDKKLFLKAVHARIKTKPKADTIILRPSSEEFEDLNGDSLEWSFYSFGIGIAAFLFILLFPGYDKEEHTRQLSGEKTRGEDYNEFIALLLPTKEHFSAPVLLNLNILIFLVIVIAGVSIINPTASDLLAWGGNRRFETTNGDWWRLISSMFLHGGIMHLLLNCFGLLVASLFIEPAIGKWRFLAVYMISGICGSLASIWWYENTVSVGASGAIFGLFGATLGLLLTNAFPTESKSSIFKTIGVYVGINLLWGLTGGVDNAAHLGGLISGFFTGILIYLLTKNKAKLEI